MEVKQDVTMKVANEFHHRVSADPTTSGGSNKMFDTFAHPDCLTSQQWSNGGDRHRTQRVESRVSRLWKDWRVRRCSSPIPKDCQKTRLVISTRNHRKRQSKPFSADCDQGYSANKVPPKLKPNIICQEYDQYTYNWFLVEYRTLPLSRGTSIRRHQNQ